MFNISTIEIEKPWGLNSGFNPNIDFCVWVLQIDGLQIPPFDRHSAGNQGLQQVGLDAQTWLTWLTNVVATQDNRLLWHVADIAVAVDRQMSTFANA